MATCQPWLADPPHATDPLAVADPGSAGRWHELAFAWSTAGGPGDVTVVLVDEEPGRRALYEFSTL